MTPAVEVGERIASVEVRTDNSEKRLERLESKVDWILGICISGLGGIIVLIVTNFVKHP